MRRAGQRMMRQGKFVESEEENLSDLAQLATNFHESYVPFYRQLGILSQ
jgi:hypothetical protein